MFYDTGIGKEGYSIIGQGQIDKILSGKPEERRELFDEAAGIVKYKRRKSLSLKKLEDERQNLTRVNDILAELEKQIGPLERQSETARIYLKMKEELKTYDINMFLLEEERLQERIREVGEMCIRDSMYARLLGFRKDNAKLLTAMSKESSLPVLTKMSEIDDLPELGQKMLRHDMLASNLYTSVVTDKFKTAFQNEYKQGVLKV